MYVLENKVKGDVVFRLVLEPLPPHPQKEIELLSHIPFGSVQHVCDICNRLLYVYVA